MFKSDLNNLMIYLCKSKAKGVNVFEAFIDYFYILIFQICPGLVNI